MSFAFYSSVQKLNWWFDREGVILVLHATTTQALQTLDNKHAGIQKTLHTVGQASFFATVELVVDFADALVLSYHGNTILAYCSIVYMYSPTQHPSVKVCTVCWTRALAFSPSRNYIKGISPSRPKATTQMTLCWTYLSQFTLVLFVKVAQTFRRHDVCGGKETMVSHDRQR